MAQSPPNDYFENRIPLVGSSLTWTGNTVNVTDDFDDPITLNHQFVLSDYPYGDFSKSVWWSWVSPATATVLLEKMGVFQPILGFLSVYAFDATLNNQFSITTINLQNHGQYTTFNVEAGREYQIKGTSQETNDLVFRLTVTNVPIFRLQPRTQTVSSNAGALFTAWAFGVKPLHYQWRFNAQDIPNATNAMFPIYFANATNAGEYCVVVSSASGGASTSEVARLIVSTNDPLPSVRALRLLGQTNFEFEVTGEEGRSYLVESSTNLLDWTAAQADWPVYRFGSETRLAIRNTNSTTLFRIRQDAPKKFFRISPYHPKNEICNSHLRQLWFASWQFAEDQHKHPEATVAQSDLLAYLVDHVWPVCPLNPDTFPRDYYVLDLLYPAGCTFGHYLEER